MQNSRGCAAAQFYWLTRRDARASWLAIGLLLAAWNAVDDEAAAVRSIRPDALRAHANVSLRSLRRVTAPRSD